MKYSVKKVKDSKGKEGYQYTGTLKDGTTFTSKKYATEQSARGDVDRQRNAHRVSSARTARKQTAPKAAPPEPTPKKKKAIGGRSPRMDRIVKKYGPAMRKKGMSQYDIATIAKSSVEGGNVEEWRKRYKSKPEPTPKKRVVGHEETSTSFGKASDIRKPTVKRKKIRSFKPKKPVTGILEGQGY